MLEDDEFDFGNIVGVDPVFGCIAYKVLLFPTGAGVTFCGVTAGTDKVVLSGDFDD